MRLRWVELSGLWKSVTHPSGRVSAIKDIEKQAKEAQITFLSLDKDTINNMCVNFFLTYRLGAKSIHWRLLKSHLQNTENLEEIAEVITWYMLHISEWMSKQKVFWLLNKKMTKWGGTLLQDVQDTQKDQIEEIIIRVDPNMPQDFKSCPFAFSDKRWEWFEQIWEFIEQSYFPVFKEFIDNQIELWNLDVDTLSSSEKFQLGL